MTSPSQVPARFPSGVSLDYPWGPFARNGAGNPFFYQQVYDDFMGAVSGNDNFKSVTSGTGATVTEVAGDGGQWLLTSSSSGAGTAGVIGNIGNFVIPPATYAGTGLTAVQYVGKKVFFACRINVTTVAAATIYAGLVPSGTTTSLPTDGIFFAITSATAGVLEAYSSSTKLWSITLPMATLSNNIAYGNAQWLDLAFEVDRGLNVSAFAGFPLFGWLPASAWTGTNNVNAAPGPLGKIAQYVTPSAGWTPPTANLTPAVILTATALTCYVDFLYGAKER